MDTTIAVFPSQNADRRLRVSLKSGDCPGGLQLIDESFSSHVGWYTQSSINLEPEQIDALRTLLGAPSAPRRPRSGNQPVAASDKPVLSIVRAG